jgi:uncharacterized membrane protein YhdT
MKFVEDPRIKVARRGLAIAWIYFAIYLLIYLGLSYSLGIVPYVLGLPRWVTFGNLFTPFLFVVMLIFVVEKLIPDVPLADEEEEAEEDET